MKIMISAHSVAIDWIQDRLDRPFLLRDWISETRDNLNSPSLCVHFPERAITNNEKSADSLEFVIHQFSSHVSFICVTWLIHVCDMTLSDVWHYVFICITWRIHMCDMPHSDVWHASFRRVTHSYVWHASFICVTCLIHMCDIPHSYVWHDSFICVTCLIHMCDMPHSYVWHASFRRVTCLTHMCDMPHSYVWHDSFAGACDMTHSRVWTDTLWCVTRRIVHVQSLKSRDLKTWRTWCVHVYDMTHSRV